MHLLDPGVVDNRQTISAFWTKCGQDVASGVYQRAPGALIRAASLNAGEFLEPGDLNTFATQELACHGDAAQRHTLLL